MYYIQAQANASGAYSAPQSRKAAGLIEMPDEYLETFIAYNGFVNFVTEEVEEENPLEPENPTVTRRVTSLTPNTEAWEAWKTLPVPEQPKSQLEILQETVDLLVLDSLGG